jgi:DNA-binding transcriptional LysR family regulator
LSQKAGIGVIPYFMAAAAGSLVPILPEHFAERGFWLQVNPDSRQLARVRATIDCIVARIEAEQDLFQSLPEG